MAVNTTQQLGNGASTQTPFPERELGAQAFRRRDLLVWLKGFEDDIGEINENQPEDHLVKLIDALQLQGKLPSLPGSGPPLSKVAGLEKEMVEMRATVDALLKAGAVPLSAGISQISLPGELAPGGPYPPPMSFSELRRLAAKKGVFKSSMNREALLAAIQEKEDAPDGTETLG